jgi:WD40 repeat protein
MWQLQTPSPQVAPQIGAHDAPVKCVGFLPTTGMVVSGGWDKKLKFWDARQPNPLGVFDMPDRVHAMDVRGNLLVVATNDRQIIAYDVSGQPREHSRMESPLKYQTRSLAVFPDQTGFAISVEEFLKRGYAVVHLWWQGSASPYGRVLSQSLGIAQANHGVTCESLGRLFAGTNTDEEKETIKAVLEESNYP